MRYSQEKVKIRNTVKNAIENKGKLNTEFNQVQISKIPDDVRDMISLCSDNKINLVNKNIAINGDDIWHEYRRHSNKDIEAGFQQIPLTPQRMSNAIFSIYNPDIIECVFATSNNPKQRQSFAYAKKVNDGYYVVIEAVGGKSNPNVTPVMVLIFNKSKWKNMMSQGLTLGEILYSKDAKMKNLLDVNFNKKNRVIAAQLDSKKPAATTPHSPRFNNSILNPSEKINPSDENSSKNLSTDVRRQSVSKVGGDTDQASKRTFSYNELVAKGNLTGVVVDKSQQVKIKTAPDGTVKIDDAYIQSEVRKQCEVLHREKGNPVYYVKVSDIGENVEITSKGVKHGYQDALKTNLKNIPPAELLNAQATLVLPEILKNSIEVNISDRSDNANHLYSHIMVGTFGIEVAPNVVEYYAVRSVIEERINQPPILSEYNILGKLHALNAKKVGLATVSSLQQNKQGAAVPNYFSYSIPQFLDDVKGVFDDTFSNDVYSHFGLTRRTTPFSNPLRYSLTPVSPAAEGASEDFSDPAKNSVTLTVDKERKRFFAVIGEGITNWDGITNTAVALTDAQAGIVRMGRSVGMTRNEIETSLQWARLANAQANNFIGGNFSRMNGNETLDEINEAQDGKENAKLTGGVSDALLKVMPKKFSKKGNTKAEQRYADFQLVGQHLNNIDRMSLEENARNNISTSLSQKQKNLLQFCEKYNIMML